MSQFWDKDWFRGLLMALLLVGVVLILLGGQQFIDASIRLPNNLSYKMRNAQEPATLQSQAEAQGLIAADLEYRGLLQQRSNAMILGGAGLVSLALGWIGYDFLRARQRKANAPPQSTSG